MSARICSCLIAILHIQEKQQQQQQQVLQPSQSKPEVPVSTPTFLTEDTADDSEEVPEEISNRILGRILVFAGLPTFFGIMSLPLFYYLKVHAPLHNHLPVVPASICHKRSSTLVTCKAVASCPCNFGITALIRNRFAGGPALGDTHVGCLHIIVSDIWCWSPGNILWSYLSQLDTKGGVCSRRRRVQKKPSICPG